MEELPPLTKEQLLRVLDHVPQRYWPPRPTQQAKQTILRAILAAIVTGAYHYQPRHAEM